MKKTILTIMGFLIITTLLFAGECIHPVRICNEKETYCYCKDCGEILLDNRDWQEVFIFQATLNIEDLVTEYKGKTYKNLKYVIKKILKELKEEEININDTEFLPATSK